LIPAGTKQPKMKQGSGLERLSAGIDRFKQPAEQGKYLRVRVVFAGKAYDKFTGQGRHGITPVPGAQREKRLFKFCFTEKKQPAVAGWTIGDVQQREQFQLINETFFGPFGSFGNACHPAEVRAVKSDDLV